MAATPREIRSFRLLLESGFCGQHARELIEIRKGFQTWPPFPVPQFDCEKCDDDAHRRVRWE